VRLLALCLFCLGDTSGKVEAAGRRPIIVGGFAALRLIGEPEPPLRVFSLHSRG
jgi:hypothetical protein